jgi:hypothetical protein
VSTVFARCLLALAALAITDAIAANQAATVQLADGDARVVSGGAERKLKAGDAVSEGDTLVTGKNGEVHLTMQDAGFMVVRPSTRFEIVRYTADGGDKDTGVFKLLAGGVRSITGWIGKFNAKSYQIQTSNATVGIRGTDHETRYVPEGSTEGEPGTYDRVYAGETSIETSSGATTVTRDQSAFQPIGSRERPRRLAQIPAFYRASIHEAMIAKKHEEIQRVVAERREARLKVLKENKAAGEDLRAKLQQGKDEGRKLTPEQRQELTSQRAALRRDYHSAREMHAEILKGRQAVEADVKAGRISPAEARERRKALNEKQKALDETQGDINRRLKEMNETADSILK